MKKNHMVLLDEGDWELAHQLGLENLSEFVRDCLSYFISGTDRELTPSEKREIAKNFAMAKRATFLRQQKITEQTEEEKQKLNAALQARCERIAVSMRKEMDRIGSGRFRKYFLEDEFGDFAVTTRDIITAIEKDAGIPVDHSDVVAILRGVKS